MFFMHSSIQNMSSIKIKWLKIYAMIVYMLPHNLSPKSLSLEEIVNLIIYLIF
jgi:hypothetical protein